MVLFGPSESPEDPFWAAITLQKTLSINCSQTLDLAVLLDPERSIQVDLLGLSSVSAVPVGWKMVLPLPNMVLWAPVAFPLSGPQGPLSVSGQERVSSQGNHIVYTPMISVSETHQKYYQIKIINKCAAPFFAFLDFWT